MGSKHLKTCPTSCSLFLFLNVDENDQSASHACCHVFPGLDMPSCHNGLCRLKLWVKESPVFKWLLLVYLSTAWSWALTASLPSSPTSTLPALCVLGILSHWTVPAHTVGLHRLPLLGASLSVSSWSAWYSKLIPSSRSTLLVSDLWLPRVSPALPGYCRWLFFTTYSLAFSCFQGRVDTWLPEVSFCASLGNSWCHYCVW